MNSETLKAIDTLMEKEGYLSDHPDDPGGRTVYGISYRYHPEMYLNGDPSLENAKRFYEREFWRVCNISTLSIPYELKYEIFDAAVQFGPRDAVKMMQTVINILWEDGFEELIVDGIMGPVSRDSVEKFVKHSPEWMKALHNCFLYLKADAYVEENNPTMIRGWFGRRLW